MSKYLNIAAIIEAIKADKIKTLDLLSLKLPVYKNTHYYKKLKSSKNSIFTLTSIANNIIVVAGIGRSIYCLDYETGRIMQSFDTGTNNIYSVVALAADQIAAGGEDGKLYICNIQEGSLKSLFKSGFNSGSIYALAVLPTGELISSGNDHSINIWDVNTGKCIKSLNGHAGIIYSLAVLGDGTIASVSSDAKIKLWNVKTGNCIEVLKNFGIRRLANLHDGRIVTGDVDGSIKIWNKDFSKPIKIIPAHTRMIDAIEVLVDGTLVSASVDKTVKLWNPETMECYHTFQAHNSDVKAVTVLADGMIASAEINGAICLWKPGTRTLTRQEVLELILTLYGNHSVEMLSLSGLTLDHELIGAIAQLLSKNDIIKIDFRNAVNFNNEFVTILLNAHAKEQNLIEQIVVEENSVIEEFILKSETSAQPAYTESMASSDQLERLVQQIMDAAINGLKVEDGFESLAALMLNNKILENETIILHKIIRECISDSNLFTIQCLDFMPGLKMILIYQLAKELQISFKKNIEEVGFFSNSINKVEFKKKVNKAISYAYNLEQKAFLDTCEYKFQYDM